MTAHLQRAPGQATFRFMRLLVLAALAFGCSSDPDPGCKQATERARKAWVDYRQARLDLAVGYHGRAAERARQAAGLLHEQAHTYEIMIHVRAACLATRSKPAPDEVELAIGNAGELADMDGVDQADVARLRDLGATLRAVSSTRAAHRAACDLEELAPRVTEAARAPLQKRIVELDRDEIDPAQAVKTNDIDVVIDGIAAGTIRQDWELLLPERASDPHAREADAAIRGFRAACF